MFIEHWVAVGNSGLRLLNKHPSVFCLLIAKILRVPHYPKILQKKRPTSPNFQHLCPSNISNLYSNIY
jgi:hypothetical protein